MVSYILWVFNFGYLLQHIGTFLQIKKIQAIRSNEGVCVDTQILFLIGALARIVWISDTQLKNFWLTYVELILALLTLSYCLYLCLVKYNTSSVAEIIN